MLPVAHPSLWEWGAALGGVWEAYEVGWGHPLKKSLFPVQQVARIVATQAAAISFFSLF